MVDSIKINNNNVVLKTIFSLSYIVKVCLFFFIESLIYCEELSNTSLNKSI